MCSVRRPHPEPRQPLVHLQCEALPARPTPVEPLPRAAFQPGAYLEDESGLHSAVQKHGDRRRFPSTAA